MVIIKNELIGKRVIGLKTDMSYGFLEGMKGTIVDIKNGILVEFDKNHGRFHSGGINNGRRNYYWVNDYNIEVIEDNFINI